jgi:hypothetical protein
MTNTIPRGPLLLLSERGSPLSCPGNVRTWENFSLHSDELRMVRMADVNDAGTRFRSNVWRLYRQRAPVSSAHQMWLIASYLR